MNKSIIFVTIVFLLTLFACEDEKASSATNNINNTNNSNESNNVTEEFCENCIHYDIETMDPSINEISNGEQVHLDTFMIFVDHAENKNFILKSLNVNIESTDEEEDKREEFYNSLGNFQVKINGIDFSGLLTETSPSEININAISLDISREQAVLVEVWADVDSNLSEINGRISIEDLLIRDKDDQSHLLEQILDAELGYNQCTLLLDWQNLARTEDPVCSMPGGLKISNEIEIEIEEPEEALHYIDYDVEAVYTNRVVYTENYWSNQDLEFMWTGFRIRVNHNHTGDIYLKYISFSIKGAGNNNTEELAFYETLFDPHLFFKINDFYFFGEVRGATEISFHPMQPIGDNDFLVVEANLWELNMGEHNILQGHLEVKEIVFGDKTDPDFDEFEWEQRWNPNLGFNDETCILREYQGAPANWQPARITLINGAEE